MTFDSVTHPYRFRFNVEYRRWEIYVTSTGQIAQSFPADRVDDMHAEYNRLCHRAALVLSHPDVELIEVTQPRWHLQLYIANCWYGTFESRVEAERTAEIGLRAHAEEQRRIAQENAEYAAALLDMERENKAREEARAMLDRVTPPIYICASRAIAEQAWGESLVDSWVKPDRLHAAA